MSVFGLLEISEIRNNNCEILAIDESLLTEESLLFSIIFPIQCCISDNVFSWERVGTRRKQCNNVYKMRSFCKYKESNNRKVLLLYNLHPIDKKYQESSGVNQDYPVVGARRLSMLLSSIQHFMNSSLVTLPSESTSIFSNISLALSLAVPWKKFKTHLQASAICCLPLPVQ